MNSENTPSDRQTPQKFLIYVGAWAAIFAAVAVWADVGLQVWHKVHHH